MAFLTNLLDTFRPLVPRASGARPEVPREIGEREALGVLGHTGTAAYGGYIVEREKNPRLAGRLKYRTYSNFMANTAIVGAGTRLFLNLVGKAKWTVEPARDVLGEGAPTSSARAEEVAALVSDMMGAMETPWPRVTRRTAMYRFYGFSVQEWTAVRRPDGAIGLLDIAPRPQMTIERWNLDITGRVIDVVQRSEQTQEEILLPRGKLVYAVDDSLSDSPEGLGIFRHLAESVQRLRLYEQLEGFAFEKDLRGIPVGRAPLGELEEAVRAGDMDADVAKQLIRGVEDFIRVQIKKPSTGVMIDSEPFRSEDEAATPSSTPKWAIELLTSQGSQGHQELLEAIERVNREIARVMGVEQLLLGEGDRGSMALARDKSHNFALIIDSTLNEMTEVMQRDFLGPLMALNGWPEELRPTLRVESIQHRDVEQITQALRDISLAGVPLSPRDRAVAEMFDLLGLTAPDPDLAVQDLEFDRAQALDQLQADIEENARGTDTRGD